MYLAAVSALRGGDSAERIEAPLSCRNSASLTFIYRRNEKNRMEASLLFNNPGINIPFVFPTLWKDVRVNHEMVYEGVQADLGVFAMILFGYVAGSSAGEFPDIEYLQKIFQAGLNP